MSPNYAAESAMKCEEPTFRRFLQDATKRPVGDKEAAAEALRLLAGVDSRKAFNASHEGAERWVRVRRLFALWRRGVGKNAQGRLHGPSIMGRVAYSRGSPRSENPFEQPPIWEEDETEYDLWEFGWNRAKAQAEEMERKT